MKGNELHQAIILAYRGGLERRYSLESIRGIPRLAAETRDLLSVESIESLKGFFLDHLYPVPAVRKTLDDAFDQLKHVLTSPRKMFVLLGGVGRSIFRLGGLIPSAISAGVRTLEAVLDIRKLEADLAGEAARQRVSAASLGDPSVFAALVRGIPERDVARFRREMNSLFRLLANLPLLEKTLEILSDSEAVMESRLDLFTDGELSGVRHGRRMISAGADLFRGLPSEAITLIQEGINLIEVQWYESIRAGGTG